MHAPCVIIRARVRSIVRLRSSTRGQLAQTAKCAVSSEVFHPASFGSKTSGTLDPSALSSSA